MDYVNILTFGIYNMETVSRPVLCVVLSSINILGLPSRRKSLYLNTVKKASWEMSMKFKLLLAKLSINCLIDSKFKKT